jgi:hypothetical protein
MELYKCNICKQEFKRKICLENHSKRKNSCNIITNYQCSICYKYFKYNKNLLEHMHKGVCLKNKHNINENEDVINEKTNDTKDAIKSLLESTIDIDNKIDILIDYKINLSKEKIKIIIESDMNIDGKLNNLCNFITNKPSETTINNSNINNGTINTNNNTNTTNNIQINNFGNEKIEYLDNDYFKDLIMNNHIQDAYMKLINDTYLHKDHPENKTIKIENLNNKFGFVFEDGKWRPILKYELKEIMHEKNNKLLKIHYKKVREFLDAAKKSSINVFFSRIYDHDPHLKFMNEQMILLFYEGKPKTTVTV